MIIPVILSGGFGTRLWPISRPNFPKQFAPILGNDSPTLFQQAILRTKSISNITSPIVICNTKHKKIVIEQMKEIGINDAKIILEPIGRNTAPAITIAALLSQKMVDNPTLLILPADHIISDQLKFTQAVSLAEKYVKTGSLLCFGIKPGYPETGYGYIKMGEQLKNQSAYKVEKFVEKPNLKLAQEYLNSGDYLWNAGIFMFEARSFLQETTRLCKDVYAQCEKVLSSAILKDNLLRLSRSQFSLCKNISIDFAVMEHTDKAIVISLDANWSDVGSWAALWNYSNKDNDNNVLVGKVHVENSAGSYIHSTKRKIFAIGVKDHIIIETDDAILVAHKDQSQAIRTVAEKVFGGE